MRKLIFISSVSIFFICCLIHFTYDFLPCVFTSIFTPVNESTFEHMKMIFTSILIYSLFEYFLFNKINYKVNNFIFGSFIKSISSIFIFLIFYLPVYYRFGENMIITFILLFISLLINSFISFKIYKIKPFHLNIISIILIIITYIIFGYFTYNPIKNHFFFDVSEEKYGINNYLIK